MGETNNDGLRGLSDDQVDSVSGGYILDRGPNYRGSLPYVVIDDETGKTVSYCSCLEAAHNACGPYYEHGWVSYDKQIITLDEYREIFGRDFGSI